jgi:UDP-glucose 4-epimerase
MVADTQRARAVLGWTPRFDLRDIAAHALAWERKSSGSEADNDDSLVGDRMVGLEA